MAGGKVAGLTSAAKADSDKKYERSSIKFPYGDLDDAVSVAEAIHKNAGTSCTPDQLAGYMKQTASSGSFRMKVGTAGIFGLVETSSGTISLTDLGRQIVDPNEAAKAKASAFLFVPLYHAVHDKFKGHLLPPAAALEREMQAFGVSPKQKDKARQAFERSAEQAGFFAQGKDRLVLPAGVSPKTLKVDSEKPVVKAKPGNGGGAGGGGDDLHPFIQGLLQTLPAPGGQWEAEAQVEWLQAAAQVFRLMYKASAPVNIKIQAGGGG